MVSSLNRPGPSNQRSRNEPQRRRRSAGSDGPLIKLVSAYGRRSSAESQDDEDGYRTGDEFARTRDDRRPRFERSQPHSQPHTQQRSGPYWNNRGQTDRYTGSRKRNWDQVGAREQNNHDDSNDSYNVRRENNRYNRYPNDQNNRYDSHRDNNYSQQPMRNDQSCQSCQHCGCTKSQNLNEPRSQNRYRDRYQHRYQDRDDDRDDSTDDDYYDPNTRYRDNRNRNFSPRRKRRNRDDFEDRNNGYDDSRDTRPADFQRRDQQGHGRPSNSILQDARGARDGPRGRFDNRHGRNIHVSRSKNDQREGEYQRQIDNRDFDEGPMTHDGDQLG